MIRQPVMPETVYLAVKTAYFDCPYDFEKCPIVILDEATAFTDQENEEKYNGLLQLLIKGKLYW